MEPSSTRLRVFEATDPWSWVWTRSCPLRPHARWSQQPRHREAATPGPADSWHLISVTIPSSLISLELTQSKSMSGVGHSNKQNLQIISQLQYLVQFIQSKVQSLGGIYCCLQSSTCLVIFLTLLPSLFGLYLFVDLKVSKGKSRWISTQNRNYPSRIVGRWKRMDLFYI